MEKSIPTLFQALTAQSDPQARWSIVTFPIDVDTSSYQPTGDKRTDMVVDSSSIQSTLPDPGLITLNCTVVYMGQCMSWNKCKASCTSMGASSYRWFHDGCCECVGSACQARPENQFGLDQSRCEECPLLEDQEVTDEEMERLVIPWIPDVSGGGGWSGSWKVKGGAAPGSSIPIGSSLLAGNCC